MVIAAILALLLAPGGAFAAPETVAIPAATVTLGHAGHPDSPVRRVTVSAFRIQKSEVSIAEFEAFVAAGGYRQPELWTPEGRAWLAAHPEGAGAVDRAAGRSSDHPVVAVTWYEADAFCRWAGGALPTEAQWEYAACGGDGRLYPWGEDPKVNAEAMEGKPRTPVDDIGTLPVDQHRPGALGPFGLLHASGNVWEWTSGWYRADAAGMAGEDPTGPSTGTWRTLRGGSFLNMLSYTTCAHREPARPDRVAYTTGFRCAFP